MLALPDALTAMTRPDRHGPPSWQMARFLGHVGAALVPSEADMGEGEALTFLFAVSNDAWRALAGRTLPLVELGPLVLSFPELPADFPWLHENDDRPPIE